MNYIQIGIEAGEPEQEILISTLSDLGATGFEQTDNTLLAYFDESDFPSYDVQAALEGKVFHINTIEEQNWNKVWESNFPPVIVEDFCAVRADFHEPVAGVQHQLLITPKMSFGTGHHATTWMMIRMMKELDFRDKTVFDFGTGTGILAILAEKLGARKVTAIDVDDWSIRNAAENLERNGCSRTEVFLTTNIPEQTFDLILANINRNVILQYMQHLERALQPGSRILFSGLLKDDEADITGAAAKHGLQLKSRMERTNWICLLFDK